MVQAFFETIAEVVTGLGDAMGQGIQTVTSYFWTTTDNGGEFTILGVISLIALGAGVLYFVISLVLGLLRSRNNA